MFTTTVTTSLLALLPALVLASTSSPVAGTTYSISPAAYTDLCIAPSSTSEGSKLIVTDCDSSSDIVWTYDGLALTNTAANMCMDITDAGDWSGNLPQIWGCYAWNRNQMYGLNNGAIKWVGKNQCLDLKDGQGVDGNTVQIWSCFDGNANQQWVFNEVEEVGDDGCDSTGAATATASASASDSLASITASITASASWSSVTAAPSVTASASTNDSSAIGGDLWAGAWSSSSKHHHHASSSVDNSSSSSTDSWGSSTTDSWGSSTTESWGSATASVTASSTASSATATSTGSADMSGYLQTSGTNVVDGNGNTVVLKGTNLGGWLVWEDWMCGITDNSGSADRFPQTTLENRFGIDQTYELLKIWQDNWLISSDFDVLAGMGFNVLRLPFSYLNFVYSNGSYIYGSDGDLDYSRLDWAVAQAKSRGMYVIPTYHIWDGQEDGYSTVSENSDDGQAQRDKMGTLWTKIAAHFAGETAVAAFDAINEPTGSAGNILQRDLYNAIRQGDSKRIIIMESISAAPDSDWTNVMYSMHEYLMMGDDESYNQNMFNQGVVGDTNQFTGFGVPTYIGEFMASDDTLTWMLGQLNSMNVWWSGWTYKTVNMDRWGLYNFGSGMYTSVDTDSFDSLSSAWSNMGSTSKSRVVDQYVSAAGGSNWKRSSPEPRAVSEPVAVSPRVEAAEPAGKRSGRHGGRSRRFAAAHAGSAVF